MRGDGFIDSEIRSGRIKYGLAIGADVAQAERGDPLEYSCGAGAGAFVLGRTDLIATIEDIAPFSSLFMDFWRRDQAAVPSHFGRTTVEAYKSHVIGAIANLFRKHPDLSLSEFDAITFHQPSGYLPMKTCAALTEDNIKRKTTIRIETYQDLIKARLSRIKQKLEIPRLVGDVEPVNGKAFTVSLCHGCERIYYPAREKCLDSECTGAMDVKRYPLIARLRSEERR